MFLITMGIFVFCLQGGFAFYESSCVRPKNVINVLFRNYVDSSISVIFYFLTGYALTFGGGENGFCGTRYFALVGLPEDKMAHCFFQYTFAATATSIVKGIVHERCTTTAFLCYTCLISGFTYPVSSYWALSENGWLKVLGFEDFAGSGSIHAYAGAASLAAAYMTGPRHDRFEKDGKMNNIPFHSVPQAFLGSFFFVLGMLAFNTGSNGSITNPGDGIVIAKVAINTIVCVLASSMTAIVFQRFVFERSCWNFEVGLNGSFIGMITICAGCNQYQNWTALIVGFLSYFVYLIAQKIIIFAKIDDPVGGLGVQMGGGFFGLVFAALFKDDGVFLQPSMSSANTLLINTVGGITIMIWGSGTITLLYVVLRYFNLHRISLSEEQNGLDELVHKQQAYCFEDVLEHRSVYSSMIVRPAKRSHSMDGINRRTR
ncbi:putative ammonium transporter 1 [Daphnia pulex]|uniref:putative ammonium transporter 1 n=1 Tax=Daphnia pulex TaxID=6669 RepID=UPI001EDD3C4A|nr:putative ammonium transporter 1 [Daphnia pulex]